MGTDMVEQAPDARETQIPEAGWHVLLYTTLCHHTIPFSGTQLSHHMKENTT